jgi:hypothetical protein
MKKIRLLLIILLGSLYGFSQSSNIEDAQKIAQDFIQALKIIDLPEGKELIKDLTFGEIESFPIISSNKIIFEKLFNTDIPDIKGYKALMEIESISKAKTPLTLRYILICYRHKKENKWKVFEFRESVDTQNEVDSNKLELTKSNKYIKIQYRYRRLAYWQILNGDLMAAKTSFLNASKEAKADNDNKFEIPTFEILNTILSDEY